MRPPLLYYLFTGCPIQKGKTVTVTVFYTEFDDLTYFLGKKGITTVAKTKKIPSLPVTRGFQNVWYLTSLCSQ